MLGDALRDARHFEPAKPLFEYVLRMRRSLEGDAEPNTLISIANLALLCVSSVSLLYPSPLPNKANCERAVTRHCLLYTSPSPRDA